MRIICECATDRDINVCILLLFGVFCLLFPAATRGRPGRRTAVSATLVSPSTVRHSRVETSSVDLATCGLVAEFSFAVQTHTDVDVMHLIINTKSRH